MSHRSRVLITRTRQQASALAVRLEALGAETVLIPTIEIAPPSSYAALDVTLDELSRPEHGIAWLLFTSANAVNAFRDRILQRKIDVCPHRIAVIGPATFRALSDASIEPHIGPVLMPELYVAHSLAAALITASGASPQHFLLVRAEEARDTIPAALEAAGHRVTIVPAYRNITPPGTIGALQTIFAVPENYPGVITFTSSSTVRNLFALLEAGGICLPPGITLASIGPVTSATLREMGCEPTIEAASPTVDSLAAAIAAAISCPTIPSSPQSDCD